MSAVSLVHSIRPAGGTDPAGTFVHWLRGHRGAVAMAGVVSFAGPATFLAGHLGVLQDPSPRAVVAPALWYLLYGCTLWIALLVAGCAAVRLEARSRIASVGLALLCSCAAVGVAELATSGRGVPNLETGVVASALTMHMYSSTFSLAMALLYFAHLQRSKAHESAAARLAQAQAAQREARRRLAHARLQAMQARIDPQLLFDMLDAVRGIHEVDPARAERLLDELVAFLRAALPRLRSASSSVLSEVELTRAYGRMYETASAAAIDVAAEVAAGAMTARFPPGVLLPLLADVLRHAAGPCRLVASRIDEECLVRMTLPTSPSPAVVDKVRKLLEDLYGGAARIELSASGAATLLTITVPHELA